MSSAYFSIDEVVMIVPGTMVRAERELRGWTQAQLGERVEMTQDQVSRLEKQAAISPFQLKKFDAAFGGAGWRLKKASTSMPWEKVPLDLREPPVAYQTAAESEPPFVDLPIMGVVPAGKPNDAIEDYQGKYPVPREFVGDSRDCVIVRAHGESMKDLGICDGDMLAFRRQDSAEDGDVVIAEVEGDGVTCKRLRRKKGQPYLEPANAAHKEIHRPFKIMGKVVWRGGRPWR